MVFSDLFFLFIFFPLCFGLNYFVRSIKAKNIILLIFSLIFYAWGEPTWVILLLFSAFFNWFMALKISDRREERSGKYLVAAAIAANIVLLLIFKYTGFFVETINSVFSAALPVPSIRLPIGISFFTFQALSYVLDVYWDTVEAQKNPFKFLLYLSFFPQLIAGPIVRYSVIEDEIDNRSVSYNDLYEGAGRLIMGLAKKVILANNLWTIVDTYFGADVTGLSTLGTWYTVIVYSLYVYFDFSGYSDMAIGMGRMFGFHFDENFKYPFMCQSITEFWQRWHISLGSFFRDYLLYVPIFGKRRKYLGLFLVWFCTGMWHGASWNYIIWGLYYGFFIFFEQKLGKKKLKSWPLWWKHLYSKLVIIIGFGIFYFENFSQLGQFLLNITGISLITGQSSFADHAGWSSFVNNIFLFIAAIVLCAPVFQKIKDYFINIKDDKKYAIFKTAGMVCCAALLLICAIALVDNTNNPFLYWRF